MAYTDAFQKILDSVPRLEWVQTTSGTYEKGMIAESTRRNMAIQAWQQQTFGNVYPPRSEAATARTDAKRNFQVVRSMRPKRR